MLERDPDFAPDQPVQLLRLAEAARLGLRRAIVPAGAMDGLVVPEGMRVHPARDLVDAVSAVQPVPLPGLPANPQRGERPPFRATA